jgi:hypothetical protein
MHIWDLACHGHSFVVLPEAFVLHRNKHEVIAMEDRMNNTVAMEQLWDEHVSESKCVIDMTKYKRWTNRTSSSSSTV